MRVDVVLDIGPCFIGEGGGVWLVLVYFGWVVVYGFDEMAAILKERGQNFVPKKKRKGSEHGYVACAVILWLYPQFM